MIRDTDSLGNSMTSIRLDVNGTTATDYDVSDMIIKSSQFHRFIRQCLRDIIVILLLSSSGIKYHEHLIDNLAASHKKKSRPSIHLDDFESPLSIPLSSHHQESSQMNDVFQAFLIDIATEILLVVQRLEDCISIMPGIFDVSSPEWFTTLELILSCRFLLHELQQLEYFKTACSVTHTLDITLEHVDKVIEFIRDSFNSSVLYVHEGVILEDVNRQDWKSNSLYKKGMRVSPGVFALVLTMKGILSDMNTSEHCSCLEPLRGIPPFQRFISYKTHTVNLLRLNLIRLVADSTSEAYR
jgi:hypothetical protein